MSKHVQNLSRLFIVFIVIVIGNYVISAQSVVNGDWKANFTKGNTGKINLSFSRESEKGKNQMSSNYDLSELQGLSSSQLSDSNVRFSIIREAGTIECEGRFSNEKGAGTFRFTPNRQFLSAMKTRGFDFEKPSKYNDDENPQNRIFAAASLNITTALADDLLSANFGNLDIDDLFKAKIFKVDSAFMREMKDSGFPDLGMEELVKARIFKIDGDYLRALNTSGFGNEPFENVVKMRIFKITPEFINGVRAEGFSDIDIEDLVKMKIFNIDAGFIRQARADGVPMNVEKLVKKRIGVWGK